MEYTGLALRGDEEAQRKYQMGALFFLISRGRGARWGWGSVITLREMDRRSEPKYKAGKTFARRSG